MNTKKSRFLRGALVAGLSLNLAGLAASSEIIDDFVQDGDIGDGNPLRWVPFLCCPGSFTPTSEGLEVEALSQLDAAVGTEEVFLGAVRVHARANFNGTENIANENGVHPHLSVGVHFDPFQLSSGYQGSVDANGRLSLTSWGDPFDEKTLDLPFVPSPTEDLEIEIFADRGHVELRVWRSGEKPPEVPQLTLTDPTPDTMGSAAFSSWNTGGPTRFYSVSVCTEPCITRPVSFLRGDSNDDGMIDIADPVYVLNHLFGGGPAPSCVQTADCNDDNVVDIADSVYLLNHLFGGGPALAAPVSECGSDPTPAANAADDLPCEAYPPCE